MPEQPLPLRAILVDDEPLARRGLRSLLRSEPDVTIVAECATGEEALRAVEALRPDLLLLDVQMPGMDGFDVVQAIPRERRPVVVFVTAYEQFALRAFDAHAVDYLLKPVDPDRLRESVARVRAAREGRSLIAEGSRADRMDSMLRQLGRLGEPRHFVVRVGERLVIVPHDQVTRLEADGNYVRLHAHGGEYVLRESLRRVATLLDPQRFLQVHRGAIVATTQIRELHSVRKGEYVVVLRDGTRVPTGPAYRTTLETWLGSVS